MPLQLVAYPTAFVSETLGVFSYWTLIGPSGNSTNSYLIEIEATPDELWPWPLPWHFGKVARFLKSKATDKECRRG
jgi:hypothetical protein